MYKFLKKLLISNFISTGLFKYYFTPMMGWCGVFTKYEVNVC